MDRDAQACIHQRPGFLVYKVGDYEQFVRFALELPQATHFAAFGNRDALKWFHPAARTREAPLVEEPEVIPRNPKSHRFFGCRLDTVARESVTGFILKCSRKPFWPGAALWHWWLYSDHFVLVSAHDWPYLILVDSGLGDWAGARLADGALEPHEPSED